MNGFILAGTNSGCGKTTLTIGLMALMASRNLRVAPFKTGPDFIDPSFHTMAAGSTSYNLDSYLLDQNTVQYLFQKHLENKDIAIVEGVMGMFDGLGDDGQGSTAELARILNLPVILVVSCKSLYQSVAAIVKGFAQFDPRVRVAGVVLNHVAAGEHYQFLKNYIETQTGIPCIGHLPNNKDIALESRHLGLVQAEEVDALSQKIETLGSVLAETIDVDLLMKITALNDNLVVNDAAVSPWKRDLRGLRLGVARDKAFRFYYEDNLELLRENGAEIIEFSPLHDRDIPGMVNAMYIGGGYPEVFAAELSANQEFRKALKQKIENGMPVLAECGGLMYLTNEIKTLSAEQFPMCGIFNCSAKMTKRLQRFGYCEVSWKGVATRAHEFHHSELVLENNDLLLDFSIRKPSKNKQWNCGLSYKNAIAGYPHFHFYSNAVFYNKIIDLWMQKTIQY
jgi:cobyrinic acid a,c-diamide synthase